MEKLIIIRYGEIALKGHNRPQFEDLLVSNIQRILRKQGARVKKRHGRMFVHCDEQKFEMVLDQLKKVFGLVSFSPGVAMDLDMEQIYGSALEQLRKVAGDRAVTFKVEGKRANKGFPIQSPEIGRLVGAYLLENMPNLKVDVHRPQVVVNVEVREQAFVFTETVKGIGGMPYKSASRGMLLLSGGIDSPVAGWMMARRGVELEAIHFHSYPFTSERAKEKVLELGRKLTQYTEKIRIYSVNLLEIQRAIQEKCPEDEITLLSRRFMMQIAERLAEKTQCKCLITGESIGQVASQTMESLNVTNAVVKMPVFRPLIAMDKLDIIEVAHKIDTYETSILPFEDCCTVFLPDRVVTRPRLEIIEASQALLDSEALIASALETLEVQEITKD